MPFETECPECQRSFKLKDELLGKKFKCSDCGAIVQAEAILPAVEVQPPVAPAAPKRKSQSSGPRRTSSKTSRPAQAKPAARKRPSTASSRKKPRPTKRSKADQYDDGLYADDYGGGAYDEYDDYSNDFGDFDDANPYADNYGTPARSKSKKGSSRSKKRKSSQGGFQIGFNINRLNIALAGISLVLGFYALNEARLAAKSQAEPTSISLAELMQNGDPDNLHVTVTGVKVDLENTVVEYRENNEDYYLQIFAPCRARGTEGRGFGMVLLSSNLHSDADIAPLDIRQSFTGMIVNEIRSLNSREKQYLRQIPGINADTVRLFQLDRKPTSTGALVGMFGLSGAMFLGALGWIFFTGSPDAAPARPRSKKTASRKTSSSPVRSLKSGSHGRSRSAPPATLPTLLFTFDGRIGRMTYFVTGLIVGVVSIFSLFVAGMILPEAALRVFMLVMLIVQLVIQAALSIKRAHDIGHSGWMTVLLFIPLANLVWGLVLLISAGDSRSNQYGPPPQ